MKNTESSHRSRKLPSLPKKGPRAVMKTSPPEGRRIIRSMKGVDSRSLGVQAELNPAMTIRSLLEPPRSPQYIMPSHDSISKLSPIPSLPLSTVIRSLDSKTAPKADDSLNMDLATLTLETNESESSPEYIVKQESA